MPSVVSDRAAALAWFGRPVWAGLLPPEALCWDSWAAPPEVAPGPGFPEASRSPSAFCPLGRAWGPLGESGSTCLCPELASCPWREGWWLPVKLLLHYILHVRCTWLSKPRGRSWERAHMSLAPEALSTQAPPPAATRSRPGLACVGGVCLGAAWLHSLPLLSLLSLCLGGSRGPAAPQRLLRCEAGDAPKLWWLVELCRTQPQQRGSARRTLQLCAAGAQPSSRWCQQVCSQPATQWGQR